MRKREKDRQLILVIVFVLVGGFLVYLLFPNYLALARYRENREALNLRIKELEKENENLKTEIKKLKADPLYIEKIAREELKMIRPGEIIYRVIPEDNKNE